VYVDLERAQEGSDSLDESRQVAGLSAIMKRALEQQRRMEEHARRRMSQRPGKDRLDVEQSQMSDRKNCSINEHSDEEAELSYEVVNLASDSSRLSQQSFFQDRDEGLGESEANKTLASAIDDGDQSFDLFALGGKQQFGFGS
jgi:hypothetical protein